LTQGAHTDWEVQQHVEGQAVPVDGPQERDRVMLGQSMTFNILFPSSYSVEVTKLRQQLDEAHLAWSKEWKQQQADFKIENIRFIHDPHWNKRFFSLQAARDGGTLFWQAAHVILLFGGSSI
jgi:hypothetical protein